MSKARRLEVLKMISEDAESDAKSLDGAPFDGHTLSKNLGKQYAAIQALANILLQIEEEK
jgi:hypothetical protein